MGISLTDIVALAKQGYKVSDIKELIELSKESTEAGTGEQPTTPEQPKDNTPVETPAEETAEADDKDSVDYKAKVIELEAKISEMQKAKTKEDMSGAEDNKSDADVFSDAMRFFM